MTALTKAQQQIRPLDILAPVPFAEARRGPHGPAGQIRNHDRNRFPFFFHIPGLGHLLNDRLLFLQTLRAAGRIIRSRQPALIHAHYLYPDGVAAAHLAHHFHLPLLLTAHGSDLNILCRQRNIAEKVARAMARADHNTFVSNDLRKKALALCPDLKGSVVANGVDSTIFFPKNKKETAEKFGCTDDELVILGIGSFIELKQFDHLITAFAELPVQQKRLVLLGDGPLENKLKHLADSTGCGKIIDFPGQVAHDQVADYLNLADILAITSRSEGWPTIIFEALACGTYIVSTAVGGIPEALPDKRYGTLYDNLNSKNCAKALLAGVNRMQRNRQARIEYAQKHSWDNVARQYEAIYAMITGS